MFQNGCFGSNNDEGGSEGVIIIAHCELHDSVNQLKFELILLFPVILEIMSSDCHCLCVFWCVFVCVDGFKMDVLVRTTMKAAAKCNNHCALCVECMIR